MQEGWFATELSDFNLGISNIVSCKTELQKLFIFFLLSVTYFWKCLIHGVIVSGIFWGNRVWGWFSSFVIACFSSTDIHIAPTSWGFGFVHFCVPSCFLGLLISSTRSTQYLLCARMHSRTACRTEERTKDSRGPLWSVSFAFLRLWKTDSKPLKYVCLGHNIGVSVVRAAKPGGNNCLEVRK